jgi:hypothetical protein
MNKKPFWKRTNRGFVVSMALLIIVLIYVVVTQIMLATEKKALYQVADAYCTLLKSNVILTDEDIEALADTTALNEKTDDFGEECAALFMDDPAYLESATDPLVSIITLQTSGFKRIASLSDATLTDKSCVVDEEVATCSMEYDYTVSGSFTDYNTEEVYEISDVEAQLAVSLVCKKIDGQWKIYRVSYAGFNTYENTSEMMIYGG